MMFCARPGFGRVLLLLALGLALLASGFAHRLAAGPTASYAQFVQAGGSLEGLCGEKGDAASFGDCLACRVLGSALLPDPADSAERFRASFESGRVALAPPHRVVRLRDPALGERAPPLA